MRTTSRRKPRSHAPDPEVEHPTLPELPERDDPPERAKVDRLATPMREDGTFDIEAMRATTRERLKRAYQDPTLAARLGVNVASAPASDSIFDPSILGVLYDAAGSIAIAMAMRSGYTLEQSLVLRFTAEEKASVCPLTARVLDKWIPYSGKYQDEVLLALSLFGIVSGKLSMLRKPAPVIHMVPQPPQAPSEPVQ